MHLREEEGYETVLEVCGRARQQINLTTVIQE
jgi:hypothetical protein